MSDFIEFMKVVIYLFALNLRGSHVDSDRLHCDTFGLTALMLPPINRTRKIMTQEVIHER